jgi:hypothetical protein
MGSHGRWGLRVEAVLDGKTRIAKGKFSTLPPHQKSRIPLALTLEGEDWGSVNIS